MEKGQYVQDTLPTIYGIIIAFLTCLIGYALWVSVIYVIFTLIRILFDLIYLFVIIISLYENYSSKI